MSTDSGSETETKQVGEQKETSQKRNKENSDKESEQQPPKKKQKTENTELNSWELGSNRRVKLNTFKGKQLIDIREYYEDKETGEMKPGKKGISLTLDQWENLKKHIEAIDKALKQIKK